MKVRIALILISGLLVATAAWAITFGKMGEGREWASYAVVVFYGSLFLYSVSRKAIKK